jgi:hypothetical protein
MDSRDDGEWTAQGDRRTPNATRTVITIVSSLIDLCASIAAHPRFLAGKRWSMARGRWSAALGLWPPIIVSSMLLAGCMLMSGQRGTTAIEPDAGSTSVLFVSADGADQRTLDTGRPGTLEVIASLRADDGDLRLDVLDPNGAVVFSLQSRPGEQVTRSGQVATDAEGRLRYRVLARGARNGGYELLYRRI